MDSRVQSLSKSTYATLTSFFSSLTVKDNPLITKMEEAALKAAHIIGPRTYVLKGLKNEKKPLYWVVGCGGNKSEAQEKVAKLMNDIAKTAPDQRPDFILFLGDNFYDYGVNSPTDNVFKTHFHHVYGLKKLEALFNIPCFLLLGNHDYNIQKWKARLKSYTLQLMQGKAIGFNQVAHTYIPEGEKYNSVEELFELFKQDTLELNSLQQFNMPYSFYSLIAGNTQIFCLDSNFIVQDFLELMNEENANPDNINQLQWLLDEYAKAKKAGREIHFAMHHSPYTSGKRAVPNGHDSSDYLSKEQLIAVNRLLNSNTTSYNELILLILKALKLAPDKILAAHDHFLSIDDNPDFFVLTSGGGGGDLQNRKNCKRHPYVKLFLSTNGFHGVSEQRIDTYTTSGMHLAYDTNSHSFIHTPSDVDIENMRIHVLKICTDYLNSLKQKEQQQQTMPAKINENTDMISSLYSYGTHMISKSLFQVADIDCVHEFMATFNQFKLPDYVDIINYLLERPKKIEIKNGPFSFYKFFYNEMEKLKIDLDAIQLSLSDTFVKVHY